jgi:eukaryotic-like serine/threonine-protein kinase
MPAPTTVRDFLQLARKSSQIDEARLDDYLESRAGQVPFSPRKLAVKLIRAGVMTAFQAEQFLLGRHKGFRIGSYRIIDRLGSGGAGLVYLARHAVLEKRFAIKVLPQACAADPGVIARFRREARAAALLDHPNVVQVYDFREEDGLSYIVMEYIEGPTLQQLLHRRKRLAVATACEYARQAALGLQHAHELGLVHRDVKPGNLMVDATGTVKVLDLGLARYEPEAEKDGESLTRKFNSNQVLGTSDYLSPEQALSLHDVDGRADIYSLGATLYALLTGEPPFPDGSVAKKLMMHQTATPTPVHALRPEVPEDLSDVIAKMLAKKPHDRFPSAGVVALALARWAEITSHSELQPSNQTLTKIRIDPAENLLGGTTGAIGRPGGLAPDTVMASDGDTISLSPGNRPKPQRSPNPTTPTPPSREAAATESTPKRRRPRSLAMIGLGVGLAVGLAVGAVGLMLLW